ncbi:MAG: hypothetical protein JNK90_00915 [Planctomycetaceae bacterium]|nr:hypothetical protein [Planctomycetaceae bacterium]
MDAPNHLRINQNHTTESVWDFAATWLFHAIFLGQVLMYFVGRGDSAGIGDWISTVSAAALCAVGAIHTQMKWNQLPQGLRNWIAIAGIVSGAAIVRGFTENDVLKTLFESLPYAAIVFFPAIGFPTIPKSLVHAFSLHALFGVLACGYVLVSNQSVVTADDIQRSDTLELKSVQFSLYSLFFVFFRLASISFLMRLVVIFGLVEMATFAVASATRQALVLLTGVVSIGIWNVVRASSEWGAHGQVATPGAKKGLVLLLLVCVLGYGAYEIVTRLAGGMAMMEARLTTARTGTSIWENDRLFEVQQLIEQFEFVDLLIGRGVRGAFVNSAAPNNDNVHIGWFRVLLKAGVFMVALLVIGPVWNGVYGILHARDPVVLAAAGMCCYFAVKNTTGNIVLPFPNLYIVLVCFGACAGWNWGWRYDPR